MPDTYWLVHGIVTAAQRAAVEQALSDLLSPVRPGLVFTDTFSLPLSASGTGPATHYATTSAVLPEDWATLAGALASWPGAVWMWRGYKPDEASVIIVTDPSQAHGDPLERWWTVDVCASALGLVRVQEDSP